MTTTPDFRSLCAELLAAFEIQLEEMSIDNRLCQRARAVLATPPPEPTTSQITFNDSPAEEVIRFDKEGFHYKGQFIADAGEAHRLMLAFLKQHAKVEQEPPTDQEIEEWADAATEVPLEEMDPDIHGWQRCFTKEEFCASIRAALERWGAK